MDPALAPTVPDRRPPAGSPGSGFDPENLARTFGLPDLPRRLAAVDERITEVLDAESALLGPASTRVAGAGGKRLRPLFTIVCAALGDVFDEKVVNAAAAVELVQVGSLVHDDILDDATSRRGRPTINAVEGLSHAVLAGDYMLARAAELAASVSREAAELLAITLGKLCEGQVLELRDVYDPDRTVESHLSSISGKTAALFECACRLGAHCGGLAPDNAAALARFGDAFGMGFQILDDLLDLVADADRLGKPTGNDVASGVYTLPVLTALQGPEGDQLRLLLGSTAGDGTGEGHGADTTGDDLAKALSLVRRSEGIPAALTAMDRYADEAARAVAHLNQTAVGEGLAEFPRAYSNWAFDSFLDTESTDSPFIAAR